MNPIKSGVAIATARSDCKGHNSCKGQGWVNAKSAKECTDMGGKIVK